jgi:hypothetical protein
MPSQHTRTPTHTSCVYGPCFVCVMRMLHGRVSCFKFMNMNEQEHELELEQHKNLNINLYLNTRFTSYSHAAPSPFSLRARVRTSMDATMSCFIDSAVAAYVCACVLFGSFFSRMQASPSNNGQTLRGFPELPDRFTLCGRDSSSTCE